VFFGWLATEGERENLNPMRRVEGPKVTKKAKAFFTDEELAKLLKTSSGSSFADRRDTAIMRIFTDTGIRVSGLAGLRYIPDEEDSNDVFPAQRRLRIRLKGGDETWVPIGKKAAAAVDKYIRARARHPQAASPWLWLGVQGHNTARMTDSGVRDMVGRRGEQAGIQNVHPHRFRRSFADSWLAAGGSTDDLMRRHPRAFRAREARLPSTRRALLLVAWTMAAVRPPGMFRPRSVPAGALQDGCRRACSRCLAH
jgi:site-specific recombinase XerD